MDFTTTDRTMEQTLSLKNITVAPTNLVSDLLVASISATSPSPIEPLNPAIIIGSITMILISITGIVGNSSVLFIIIRYKEMQNITNYFIANLAITDVAVLWICAVPTILNFIQLLDVTTIICKVVQYIQFVTVQATCCTLTAMTVDRYNLIVHAVKSRTARTTRKAIIISVFIWLVSFTLHLPILIFEHVEDGQCQISISTHFQKWYTLFAAFSMYVIPLTIILFCYAKILALVWRKLSAGTESAQAQERSMRQKKKITRMVFVVILLFAVCWLPVHLFNLAREFFKEYFLQSNQTLWGAVQMFVLCLSYANSCVNPFIYAFTTASFKKHFKNVFSLRFADNENSSERKTDGVTGYKRIGKFEMNSGITCDTKV